MNTVHKFTKVMNFISSITYSAIFAADLNGGIGYKDALPWDYPEDMKWFKDNTVGKCVIMGATTYRSIGKALPNRLNIVISRKLVKSEVDTDNLKVFASPELAEKWIRDNQSEYPELCKGEIMIMGGAQIYRHYQHRISRVYKTTICDTHVCDTYLRFNEEGWDLRYMNRPSYISPLKFEIWDKKEVFDVFTG